MENNLVNVRKDGQWNYYSLNLMECNKIVLFFMQLITDTEDCICKDKEKCNCN